MGLSSKKVKTTSNQSIAPTSYAQPYVTQAADTLKPAFEESQQVARAYQPGLMNAANYYGDVMGGKHLDGNPHLQGVIDSTNSDITDAVNGQFNSRFGSGYHAKALARELGNNEARLRYGDYAQERAYQNDAPRGFVGTATAATALPMLPAQGYAQNVAGLLGRYLTSNGTSTQKQSGGLLGDILGAGLAGWASGGFGI